MSAQVDYRLRIRTADDTADALVISSVPTDSAPYLYGAPTGDGASIDPLTGQTQASSFSGQIVDAITSGTDRVLTSQLEDANFRQQLGDRRAVWEFRDGSNSNAWQTLVYGFLTKLALASDILWNVTVSDPTRAEHEYTAFAPFVRPVVVASPGASAGAGTIPVQPLPFAIGLGVQITFGLGRLVLITANAAAGATSLSIPTSGPGALGAALSAGDTAMVTESIASFVARWPNRGCVFGGPVTGGLLTVPDRGGWEMTVAERATTPSSFPRSTWLRFLYGYGPPKFERKNDIKTLKDVVLSKAGPLFTAGGRLRTDGVISFDQLRSAGPWPGLVVEIIGVGYFQPDTGSDFTDLNPSDGRSTQFLKGDGKRIGVMITSQSLTVSNSTVRVRCFQPELSDLSPLYWTGHPLDLLDVLWTEANLPHDSTADATQWAKVRADVGGDRRLTVKVTAAQNLGSFLEANIYGPWGIGVRVNASGRLEPFSARIIQATVPTTTITNDDIIQGATTAFSLDTSTAVRKVTLDQDELLAADGSNLPLGDYLPQDAANIATDGFVVRHRTVQRTNGDPAAIGRNEQQYTLMGMAHTKDGKPDAFNVTNAIAEEIFDRYGRGLVTGQTQFLRGAHGDGVQLGDEVLISLKQLPNHNKRLGDDGTAPARAMQVTRITPALVGAEVELSDSGPNAQPLTTVPTLSIAADPNQSNTNALVTVTNAATLNTAGLGLDLQMSATTGGTPASDDYTPVVRYAAGQIPTDAIPLPTVTAGRTVYARARSTSVSARPSAYSTAVSVALSALAAPTSLAATPVSGDNSQEVVTWVIGTNAVLCEVDVFLRASGAPSSDAIRQMILPPGSNRATLLELTPSNAYIVGVQHRDPATRDVSTTTELTFTAGSTTATLPTPKVPMPFSGPQDVHPSIPATHPGLYGMTLLTADPDSYVIVSEAIETAVGGGTYGPFVDRPQIPSDPRGWTVFADVAPNDGLRRQLKARHVRNGATGSADTATITVTPYTFVAAPAAPLVTPVSTVGRNRCRLQNSTSTAVPNTTVTTLSWDTEDYNTGPIHSTTTNPSRITIPTGGDTGMWLVAAGVNWASNASGYRNITIIKNGATAIASSTIAPANGLGTEHSVFAFDDAPSVGDYYEVHVSQTSGGSLNAVASQTLYFAATHLW